MANIKIAPVRIICCCALGALFCFFSLMTVKGATNTENSCVPFKSDMEPSADDAARFEVKVKGLPDGQIREAVRQELGEPDRRLTLEVFVSEKPSWGLEVEIKGVDYMEEQVLEAQEIAEREVWIYEFDEGEQTITTTIHNSFSDVPSTVAKIVHSVRQYRLYFYGDALFEAKAHSRGVSSRSAD